MPALKPWISLSQRMPVSIAINDEFAIMEAMVESRDKYVVVAVYCRSEACMDHRQKVQAPDLAGVDFLSPTPS